MSKANNPLNDPSRWSAETQLAHGGIHRSEFNETSEALFLISDYSYPRSDHAERLFKGEIPSAHNYSRFANPTVDVFQNRMAPLLEDAEAARGFATGMAVVIQAVMSQIRNGDHIVASRALFG
ncbi:MAG: PLP-dependent transferase [Candidatus Devosia symbiotica]|nr:PLP-dependent transferase [Candidatus Devosia symbiotica]